MDSGFVFGFLRLFLVRIRREGFFGVIVFVGFSDLVRFFCSLGFDRRDREDYSGYYRFEFFL